MQYQVSQSGEVVGTFDFDQIVDGIRDGTFSDADHYWCEGMAGWETIAHFKSTKLTAAPRTASSRFAIVRRTSAAPVLDKVTTTTTSPFFGFIGGALLVAGSVTPFLKVGIISLTLFKSFEVNACILIVLGLMALALSSEKTLRYLLFVGLTAVVTIGHVVLKVSERFIEMDVQHKIMNSRRSAVHEAIMASVGADYGAVLLIVGCACLLYAGVRSWFNG